MKFRVVYRHVRSRREYTLIGFGKMQAEHWTDSAASPFTTKKVDMREVAVYRSDQDGALWVRPREEFYDGRFEVLSVPTSVPTTASTAAQAPIAPAVLTVKQASERYGISPSWFRTKISCGALHADKSHRTYLLAEEDVARIVKSYHPQPRSHEARSAAAKAGHVNVRRRAAGVLTIEEHQTKRLMGEIAKLRGQNRGH